jgi:hypothetical protein
MAESIPKIIHQIWIGPKACPYPLIESWKNKNPDFQHILWTEQEFENQGIRFEAQERIDMISEYCGKTDIMRLELLYRFGGIFIDADSICIEPIGPLFDELSSAKKNGFATYENENTRKGLVANGNLAIIPKHPLLREMLDWILSDISIQQIQMLRAWASVGPVLLTNTLKTGNYSDFAILPSYYFLPIHLTGIKYSGHSRVYAHQLWGTNFNFYDNRESIPAVLPADLLPPSSQYSATIEINPLHICRQLFINQISPTLHSLKGQRGHFGLDIYFLLINSLSPSVFDFLSEEFLLFRNFLADFERKTRFIKIHILSKSDFLSSKINSYINISPNCILYPDTIEKVANGNIVYVPCYEINDFGNLVTTRESCKIYYKMAEI